MVFGGGCGRWEVYRLGAGDGDGRRRWDGASRVWLCGALFCCPTHLPAHPSLFSAPPLQSHQEAFEALRGQLGREQSDASRAARQALAAGMAAVRAEMDRKLQDQALIAEEAGREAKSSLERMERMEREHAAEIATRVVEAKAKAEAAEAAATEKWRVAKGEERAAELDAAVAAAERCAAEKRGSEEVVEMLRVKLSSADESLAALQVERQEAVTKQQAEVERLRQDHTAALAVQGATVEELMGR